MSQSPDLAVFAASLEIPHVNWVLVIFSEKEPD